MNKIDYTKYPSIMGNAINSVITSPNDHSVVSLKHGDMLQIRGWAVGDGTNGGRINRVEISKDEGVSWKEA
jgi:hypothetical protein